MRLVSTKKMIETYELINTDIVKREFTVKDFMWAVDFAKYLGVLNVDEGTPKTTSFVPYFFIELWKATDIETFINSPYQLYMLWSYDKVLLLDMDKYEINSRPVMQRAADLSERIKSRRGRLDYQIVFFLTSDNVYWYKPYDLDNTRDGVLHLFNRYTKAIENDTRLCKKQYDNETKKMHNFIITGIPISCLKPKWSWLRRALGRTKDKTLMKNHASVQGKIQELFCLLRMAYRGNMYSRTYTLFNAWRDGRVVVLNLMNNGQIPDDEGKHIQTLRSDEFIDVFTIDKEGCIFYKGAFLGKDLKKQVIRKEEYSHFLTLDREEHNVLTDISWEVSEAFAKTFAELTLSVTKPTKPTIEVEYLRLCKHNTKKLVRRLFELTNSDYKHLLSIFELPGSLLKCTNINADPDMQTTLKVEGCARSQFTPIDVYTLYSFLRSYSIGNERIRPEKINDLLKTMKSEGKLKDSRKG